MEKKILSNTIYKCKICNCDNMKCYKQNNFKKNLDPKDFSITDFNYGVTGELWECGNCGFIQCVDIEKPEVYYNKLVDKRYVDSAQARAIQAKKFLKIISNYKKKGKLLDVGAGCGILLSKAKEFNFEAIGIEPSVYLSNEAKKNGLTVYNDVFPPKLSSEFPINSYDVIVMSDIIEHVPEPLEVLKKAYEILKPDGLLFMTTPDKNSLPARILQHRWWHFRLAHIGYFSKSNLILALEKTNFKILKIGRPSWDFEYSYLRERLSVYLPFFKFLKKTDRYFKFVIPINLFDSFFVCARKENNE